ncbi:hypothetical protein C8J57DRAFT_1577295 [Mycena rebaudengoi]|nr:hypothetical protein C8J57DRAFT_1577295 [Mycena rebaudengoi]
MSETVGSYQNMLHNSAASYCSRLYSAYCGWLNTPHRIENWFGHSSHTPDHIFLRVDDRTRYTLQLHPQHVRARLELCPACHAPAHAAASPPRAHPAVNPCSTSCCAAPSSALCLRRWSACPPADEPAIIIVWADVSSCPPDRLCRPYRSSIMSASYSASSHKHCRRAPIDAPVPDLGALHVVSNTFGKLPVLRAALPPFVPDPTFVCIPWRQRGYIFRTDNNKFYSDTS